MAKILTLQSGPPAIKEADELFDDGRAAKYLYVTERTLRLWRRRGLPHLKPTAKTILYRKSDLDGWLAKFRTVISG